MKPLLQSETTTPTLIHHFDEVFGVKIPLPALPRLPQLEAGFGFFRVCGARK
jgi:hypothetical protein